MHARVVALLSTERLPERELGMDVPTIAAELFAEEADPYVGTTIGAYEVQGILGTGGMGLVYLAVHREYKGPAALKLFVRCDLARALGAL